MIDPFAVVALSPRTFQMRKRGDALENTKRICRFMHLPARMGLASPRLLRSCRERRSPILEP